MAVSSSPHSLPPMVGSSARFIRNGLVELSPLHRRFPPPPSSRPLSNSPLPKAGAQHRRSLRFPCDHRELAKL